MDKQQQERLTIQQIIHTVKQTVKEVELLQKTIDNQPVDARQTIAGALIRQKRH